MCFSLRCTIVDDALSGSLCGPLVRRCVVILALPIKSHSHVNVSWPGNSHFPSISPNLSNPTVSSRQLVGIGRQFDHSGSASKIPKFRIARHHVNSGKTREFRVYERETTPFVPFTRLNDFNMQNIVFARNANLAKFNAPKQLRPIRGQTYRSVKRNTFTVGQLPVINVRPRNRKKVQDESHRKTNHRSPFATQLQTHEVAVVVTTNWHFEKAEPSVSRGP